MARKKVCSSVNVTNREDKIERKSRVVGRKYYEIFM